jgi:hypothetical protein
MSRTIFEMCFYCGKVEAVGDMLNRPACRPCYEEWAPGATFVPRPLPPYEAPCLTTHGDIRELIKPGKEW